jgi:hypothetical protein
MLRKYHGAITPALREQQMVGFVLMSMLRCFTQHTYRYVL